MNIGIDITPIIYQRGVSRYTSNLIKSLAKRKNINLSLYGSSFRQKDVLRKLAKQLIKTSKGKNTSKIQGLPPSLLSLAWRFGFNKIKTQIPQIEAFHSWDWLQPPDKDLALISTIHDLAILKFPETAHPKILKAHQRSWKILKERQARIIAVSHATKKDIINFLEIPAWQITVIHEAMPIEVEETSESLTEEEYQEIKKRLALDRPYLFFIGTREPRKNLSRLVQAWEALAKDYQLIIAGEAGWDATSKQNFKSNHPQLRFLGRVTDQELAVLYGEAKIFVYPSLYEGFGLPILEAFYHGTPVVTSNLDSFIEVAGNAAEYAEPKSIESIQQAIKKVLNESKDKEQERLQRMIIRMQMFSWDKVAEETIKVYQKAIEEKKLTT
ncbi:MAG: glycosyltransferase family 1 protein [Candidatus Woesebacteria bacterium]|jgi:glycosyltransferase involved in cell wall biosynthesis